MKDINDKKVEKVVVSTGWFHLFLALLIVNMDWQPIWKKEGRWEKKTIKDKDDCCKRTFLLSYCDINCPKTDCCKIDCCKIECCKINNCCYKENCCDKDPWYASKLAGIGSKMYENEDRNF